MPMKKRMPGGWVAELPGWGLIEARTGRAVNPVDLVSEEKFEITDWELQDFAVEIVVNELKKEGFQLMSWQGNPRVDPTIWFVGQYRFGEDMV